MLNLIEIIKHWSITEKNDWQSIKSKIRIVGVTERTKNSPNTWRWQQQPKSQQVLDGIKVKNVSVGWNFWSELGNNQNKVTPSNSPDKWASEEISRPNINKKHLEGLNFAYKLNILGLNEEVRNRFKTSMQEQIEMEQKWFKEWYKEI
ncbi:hypothetical protein [Flagellimonas sp. W118]|uniref:hypothetical protein n=1 Tax=Flagellimonas sp. W118 TaxID=3410791 RepID=UPI003BF59780